MFYVKIDMNDGEVVYLNTVDEHKCNWMMFVRPAENYDEQNLIMFQYQESLYFTTTKDIAPKDELKVFFFFFFQFCLFE